MKPFINLGTRNKGTYWEYVSAYSFLHTKIPVSKYDIPTFLGFGKGHPNQHCHHSRVIEDTKKLIVREFEQGLYTPSFFNQLRQVYEKPLPLLTKILEEDFTQDSLSILIRKWKAITKILAETHKPMLLALKSLYIEDYAKHRLVQSLPKSLHNADDVRKILSLLLTPTQLTIIQKEESILARLTKQYTGKVTKLAFSAFCKKPEVKTLLKHLAAEFGWFHMEYMQEPWTVNDYRKVLWARLKENSDSGNPEDRIKSTILQQNGFYELYSYKFKPLAETLKAFAHILDSSKAMIIKGSHQARPLLTHLANKLGLTWNELLYLIPQDLERIRDSVTLKTLVQKRKKTRAVLLKNGKISVYQGQKAQDLHDALIVENVAQDETEIPGIIAQPGLYTGKATLIESIKDKSKFKKGDVLVTHDGSAELTYFLKNAGAIVTNQGGMISHAAIVAREMKTPAILGTKIATQIFKDGDIVEVDANKGIVKKVKKK